MCGICLLLFERGNDQELCSVSSTISRILRFGNVCYFGYTWYSDKIFTVVVSQYVGSHIYKRLLFRKMTYQDSPDCRQNMTKIKAKKQISSSREHKVT